MPRTTLLAVAGCLTVLAVAGAGPSSSSAAGPTVIQVTTDTPLGTAAARNAGAPVNPGPFSVEQPDGSRVTVTAWGDSRTGGYQTEAGYAVTKDASGVWRYAVRLDGAGRPVSSNLEVGKAAPPAAARNLRATAVSSARAAGQPMAVERAPGTGNGPQPALVILVSFADQGSVGSTEDQWAQQFFGAGTSVSGYYQANSFGKFSLVPAAESGGVADNGVVGWLQLPYDHPNFGNHFNASETKLGVDAITAADPYVDYRSFDTNKNGSLSVSELHITVIVAGYEMSYGGESNVCGNSVWGHQGGLDGSAPKLDGTVVNRNGGTMFGEWMCQPASAPGQRSSIGVMVHEIGHDIGLPSLFDTDFSSAGIGRWSAMSTGSWNRVGTAFSGSTPAGLDAFSKSYQGWVAPTSVVGAVNGVPLPSSATSPTAYRLGANPDDVDWKLGARTGTGEYFLVENRQLVGWDAGLPACGVIVYHVDESVTSSNKANADEAHRLVDVVEADGSLALNTYGYGGSAADLFPGSSGHTDFTDATLPPATLYSGAPSGAAMHVDGGCADPMTANLFTPLPNDSFAAAIRLTGTSGSLTAGNNGATKEAGEPAVAANPGGASIWYRFKAPATGKLRLSTEGSPFNTLLGVYRGSSVAALHEVANNDDVNPTTGWSRLTAKVRRGVTYAIAIDGQNLGAGAGQGPTLLGYRYLPRNDRFARATKLSGEQGKKISSNAGAGRERKEPRKIAGKKAGQSVWYVYRAKRAGRLTIDLSGSRFDTVLGVYTGSKVTKLHRVAADDDSGRGESSRVSFPVTEGTKYRILVAGVKQAEGRLRLQWRSVARPSGRRGATW